MGKEEKGIKRTEKEAKKQRKREKKAWRKEPENEFPRLNSTAVEFTMRLLFQ
jgi:hypothetical protein